MTTTKSTKTTKTAKVTKSAKSSQTNKAPKKPNRIKRAIEVATMAHEGQFRKTGEPYIIHPLAVKKFLKNGEWTKILLSRAFYTILSRILILHLKIFGMNLVNLLLSLLMV